MDPIDLALSELESRMDRLRALYEQYFMGIERLEPSVPRKDVERRLHELRKTPFRNTAKRFKFQTLAQRYSTMQQYWQRICREIENGTYKRHRLRAERTIGSRFTPPAREEQSAAPEESSPLLPDSQEAELSALLDSALDPKQELERALAATSQSPQPIAAPAAQAAPTGGAGSLLGRLKLVSAPASSAQTGSQEIAQAPGTPHPAAQQELTDPPLRTAAPLRTATPPVRPTVQLPSVAAPPSTGPSRSGPSSTGPSRPLPPPVRPATPAARPPAASSQTPAPPQIPAPPRPPAPAARAPLATSSTPAARPPVPPPAPAAPTGSSSPGLNEHRMREIHQQYIAARAQTRSSSVSYEKLAHNLLETERKLREKHKRNVDFDVVIQNGKAILKPKLR